MTRQIAQDQYYSDQEFTRRRPTAATWGYSFAQSICPYPKQSKCSRRPPQTYRTPTTNYAPVPSRHLHSDCDEYAYSKHFTTSISHVTPHTLPECDPHLNDFAWDHMEPRSQNESRHDLSIAAGADLSVPAWYLNDGDQLQTRQHDRIDQTPSTNHQTFSGPRLGSYCDEYAFGKHWTSPIHDPGYPCDLSPAAAQEDVSGPDWYLDKVDQLRTRRDNRTCNKRSYSTPHSTCLISQALAQDNHRLNTILDRIQTMVETTATVCDSIDHSLSRMMQHTCPQPSLATSSLSAVHEHQQEAYTTEETEFKEHAIHNDRTGTSHFINHQTTNSSSILANKSRTYKQHFYTEVSQVHQISNTETECASIVVHDCQAPFSYVTAPYVSNASSKTQAPCIFDSDNDRVSNQPSDSVDQTVKFMYNPLYLGPTELSENQNIYFETLPRSTSLSLDSATTCPMQRCANCDVVTASRYSRVSLCNFACLLMFAFADAGQAKIRSKTQFSAMTRQIVFMFCQPVCCPDSGMVLDPTLQPEPPPSSCSQSYFVSRFSFSTFISVFFYPHEDKLHFGRTARLLLSTTNSRDISTAYLYCSFESSNHIRKTAGKSTCYQILGDRSWFIFFTCAEKVSKDLEDGSSRLKAHKGPYIISSFMDLIVHVGKQVSPQFTSSLPSTYFPRIILRPPAPRTPAPNVVTPPTTLGSALGGGESRSRFVVRLRVPDHLRAAAGRPLHE